jgi:uncharacterized protein
MITSKDMQEVEYTIQRIIEKLRVGYAPQKVILFGSYVSGNVRSDSDLDLLIIKDTAERFIDRGVTVRRVLADPQRLLPLEILVLTPQEVTERLAVGDQFMTEILEKGRVLYAA